MPFFPLTIGVLVTDTMPFYHKCLSVYFLRTRISLWCRLFHYQELIWITGFKWYLLDFFTVKLIFFSIKLSIL